jgi:hypothetical protein
LRISKKNKDFYFQILEEYQNSGEYHPYTCGKCPDTKLKLRLVCGNNFQFYCDCGYSQYISRCELQRISSVIFK